MRLIKPLFEIKEQELGLNGVYKQIEWAGRHCYKSLDKITEDSAKGFVERMIQSGHGAMLEHGTVYLKVLLNNELVLEDAYGENNDVSAYNRYINNKYSKVNYRDGLENIFITDTVEPGYAYITTNLRVLVENNWLDDLKYLCEPTEYHEKRITVKFICDRGVSHEFVRHRVFSFAQESTRYCNYSKDKFDNEITYILPPWIGEADVRNFYENSKGDKFLKYNEDSLGGSFIFLFNLEELEETYITLVKEEGWKPQQARAILPNALKTELVMTGFVSDWKHFFELRDTGSAHPQARELAQPLHKLFIEKQWLD